MDKAESSPFWWLLWSQKSLFSQGFLKKTLSIKFPISVVTAGSCTFSNISTLKTKATSIKPEYTANSRQYFLRINPGRSNKARVIKTNKIMISIPVPSGVICGTSPQLKLLAGLPVERMWSRLNYSSC